MSYKWYVPLITYPSATVEDPSSGKRYMFATAILEQDHIEVRDKTSGNLLATVLGSAGPAPSHPREWRDYGEGVRVKENCSPCTRNRRTKVENI